MGESLNIFIYGLYFVAFPIYLLRTYAPWIFGLYLYHTIFIFIYYNTASTSLTDSGIYWLLYTVTITTYDHWWQYFGTSTDFLQFINYGLIKFLGFNFFSGFLLYGFLGFVGILQLYHSLKYYTDTSLSFKGIKLWILILFLPNMHFWTAAIGKDSSSFFCISLIIFYISKYQIFNMRVLIFGALLFMVRPHIAIFLFSGLGAALIISGKIPTGRKLLYTTIGAITIPIMIFYTLSNVNLDTESVESIQEDFNSKADALGNKAGSSIPMTSYPISYKYFTVFFRPALYDINNTNTAIIAIENSFHLLMIIIAVKLRFRNKTAIPFQIRGILYFSLIVGSFYAFRLGNLGIIIREKNMFAPFLFLYALYILSAVKYKRRSLRMNFQSMPQIPNVNNNI